MANITAAEVKKLRDATGAGMMECKAALAEAGGNIEEATTILRKRGLAQATKRLQSYRKRLRKKAAKKPIPLQLLPDLLDAGDALRSDVKTIRASLSCPGDAAR